MAEVVSELDKLREAAKLIEEMSQGRLQVCPSVVGQVYIRPENEAYLGLDICDCDANSLLVSRVCGDAGCAGYTSEEPELNLPADLLAEASIPVGEEITVLVADGALLIVPTTEDLLELPVELCCLLNELGISPLSIQLPNKCCLP